jgi:hypothetical protein
MISKELVSVFAAAGLKVRVANVQQGRVHRVCPRTPGEFSREAIASVLVAQGYTNVLGKPVEARDVSAREVFAYKPGMVRRG